MTGNGFVGLTPSEAEADLQAAAARIRMTVTTTRPPSTAAERLRDAHRDHTTATTRLAIAEREYAAASDAVTDTADALEQAKQHLIADTLDLNYGAHH